MILHRNSLRARRLVGWIRVIGRGPCDCGYAARIGISQGLSITPRSRDRRVTVAVICSSCSPRDHMRRTRAWLGVDRDVSRAMNRWRGGVVDRERGRRGRGISGTVVIAGAVIRGQGNCVLTRSHQSAGRWVLGYGDSFPILATL